MSLHTGSAHWHHLSLLRVSLGSEIDETKAERLLADVEGVLRSPSAPKRILVDARGKSFASLKGQRLLASGSPRWDGLREGRQVSMWLDADADVCPSASTTMDATTCFGDAGKALHLIAGSTGAGKSTYSLQLADDLKLFYIAIDDWMHTLFADDKPDDAGFDWYMPRIERCQSQIRDSAEQLARIGVGCILDLGLSSREHRRRFLDWAASKNIPCVLHYVDTPVERRWQRVQQRNRERGETFRLEVTREMFDFVEGMFETPTAAEHEHFVHWRS